MSYNTISISTDERGVATLTLNRPDKHNAMNAELIAEMTEATLQLNSDASVRVIVLTGSGESFCAGGDLKWMSSMFDTTREHRMQDSRALARMLRTLNESPKPVIGKINGQAFGGGTGLMAVCDVTIAVETGKYSLTEVRLGLTPATISTFVVAKMGQRNARRCFLNALPMDGFKIKALGLADEVVPVSELDNAVEQEINYFLQCGPGAISATKELIRYVDSHDVEANQEYTPSLLADTWESAEGKEGIRCFFAKETASWRKS